MESLDWMIKLRADASQMKSGLQTAQGSVTSFAQVAGSAISGLATSMVRSLDQLSGGTISRTLQPLAELGSSIASFAAGAATGNIVGMVAAAVAGTASLVSFAGAGIQAIDVQARLGARLGITAQEIAGLQVVASRARIAPEAMSQAMTMWPMQLARIREQLNNPAGGELTRNLSRMGINAREFVSLPLPEQFARIAEGSRRFSNESERNAAIMMALGEQNRGLLPMFSEGATGFRNLGDAAAEMGYNISQDTANAVAGVVRDVRTFAAQLEGSVGNLAAGLGAGFAPVIREVVDSFRAVLNEGRPLLQFLGTYMGDQLAVLTAGWRVTLAVFRFAAPALGEVGQQLLSLRTFALQVVESFRPLANVTLTFVNSIMSMLGSTASFTTFQAFMDTWATGVSELIRGLAVSVVTTMREMATNIASTAEAMATSASLFGGVLGADQARGLNDLARNMREFRNGADQTIERLNALRLARSDGPANIGQNDSGQYDFLGNPGVISDWSQLAEQIERSNSLLGLSREEQELFNARMQAGENGLSEAQEERIRQLQEERRLREGIANEARRIADSVMPRMEQLRNPLEQFRDNMRDAQLRLETTGDRNLFGRELLDFAQQLERGMQDMSKAPAAALAGSVEAQKAIAEAQRQERNTQQDPIERLRLVMEQQRRVAERQEQLQERLVRAVENGELVVVGN
jgi:hypothetical protein